FPPFLLEPKWIFEGHQLGIISVATNPTGTVGASSGLDGGIRTWDLATGECVRSIDGGPVDVWTLTFSPDSQFIATGSHNGKINLFSTSEGKKASSLDTHGKFIMSVTYSPDGKLIASGAVDGIMSTIIPTAFLGSCAIFGSLSLASLYAERRSMLFLGGFLISGLNMLVMMLFFNIFLGSYMVFQLDVYGGLILFCGFVLFDTQLIVERFNNGDNDYVRHSLNLFLDFINIFRRLLVILASKEKKRKN
ncbi:WD repeat-containing protein 61, partial [Geodia barretti]